MDPIARRSAAWSPSFRSTRTVSKTFAGGNRLVTSAGQPGRNLNLKVGNRREKRWFGRIRGERIPGA